MQMEGNTGLQTMSGYVPLTAKNRHFSVALATTEVKQKKAVPSMKDNRALIDEQLNLLKTIQGGKNRESVSGRVIQGRIPNFAELNALHEKLSVVVIREKVKILLKNLQIEKLVLKGQDVDLAVKELIKDDGMVNLERYEDWFGEANGDEDKQKIYHKADQSHTALKPGDEANLKIILQSAQTTVEQILPCEKKLQEVFGSTESKNAKRNYTKIVKKLNGLGKNIAKKVTTDYNGDDAQLGIGGYADFSRQDMHIMQNLCKRVNPDGITTAIHECAHLADNSIKDYGYMGTPGFESMKGERKVNNAAHYEVIPAWILGKSIPYPVGHQFIPYNHAGGGGDSELSLGKKEANDYFESAWSVAANLSLCLKKLYSKGEQIEQTNDIMEKSRVLSLTIHQSTDHRVSLLDITLMQDMARTLAFMQQELKEDTENIVTPGIEKEIYKFHFINKIIAANSREGITPENIEYLYSLAPKK